MQKIKAEVSVSRKQRRGKKIKQKKNCLKKIDNSSELKKAIKDFGLKEFIEDQMRYVNTHTRAHQSEI